MLERELKFSPGPLFVVPDLASITGVRPDAPVTERLSATYFDSDDFRLARAGASLRYRDPEGWTVKLPAGRGELLERHELHVDGEPGDPPAAVIDLVHAIVRREPLCVVARLNTVRTKIGLRDDGGKVVGELVDDEVSLLDGARLAARFRELEVEIADDADDSLPAALVARLRAAGAGHPDPVPKIVRAIGPRAADPPDVPEPPALDFASTATDVVRAAIIRSTRRLIDHDPGVRIGRDPEAVHQARVATRRLRSDLRTFRAVLDTEWSEPLRDELKWLGGALGSVRDTEVLLERLEGRLEELPPPDADDGKALLAQLGAHREDARADLLAAMRSDRYFALLDALVDAARSPRFDTDLDDDTDDDLELSDFVRKPWRKLRDAADAIDEESSDHDLHLTRIRAKRVRYAAEAVAEALGKDARKFAEAAESVQELLGEHQDAIVAADWLRVHAGQGASAFVAGELVAMEREAAQATRDEWPEVWRKARRKKLRRWM
jgi:CHAD domain-containing protein